MPIPNIYSYIRLSFVFEKSVVCFVMQFVFLEDLVYVW